MRMCINLARKGKGYVAPNPLVGCVIVKGGAIIGKGYHRKFGEAHAEVNAINDAEKKGHDLKGATLYVSLEPCSHTSKTPPCSDLIIRKKIKEVVIGMQDPYEKVNGAGIRKLKKAGIDITTGVLEKECRKLNRFFIKFVTKKLPYVTLKIAQSIDGKIALEDHRSQWITGEESRKFVHKMRSTYDAVLIGKNTAKYDNPSLTVRDVKGRNPYRFVIDRKLSLPAKLKLFTDAGKEKTFVITSSIKGEKRANLVTLKEKTGMYDIKDILRALYMMNISSVLVEGGGNLFSQFFKSGLFDDVFLFIAPKVIGKGISSAGGLSVPSLDKAIRLKTDYIKRSGEDTLIYFKK